MIMAEKGKQKKPSIIKRLQIEYKLLEKPSKKELLKTTGQIMLLAVASAIILKGVDTGFGFLIGLAMGL